MHLRTDQTMGILLGEFQPSYEAFDNELASGALLLYV